MRTVELIGAVLLVGCCVVATACKAERRERGAEPPPEAAPSALREQKLDYTQPALDLPAARLSERVDGGERKLRNLGCKRLRFWRITQPPADLELLTFENEQGAAALLQELAGTDRASNLPGDEGWVGTNVLYFRRGTVLARLISDRPERAELLTATARDLEQAIAQGRVAP